MSRYREEVEEAVGSLPASGWQRINCPGCYDRVGKVDTKRTMSVSERGYYACHRCGLWGWLVDEPLEAKRGRDDGTVNAVELPEGSYPIWKGKGAAVNQARIYLSMRLGSQAPVWTQQAQLHIGTQDKWKERILIPFYRGGRMIGYQGRYIGPKNQVPRYLNCTHMPCVLWNEKAIDSDSPYLLVVEGVFDAIRFQPAVVACMGKPSDPQIERLYDYKGLLVFALDWDATDESMSLALGFAAAGKRATYLELPQNADPGTVDRDWMMAKIARLVDEEATASV